MVHLPLPCRINFMLVTWVVVVVSVQSIGLVCSFRTWAQLRCGKLQRVTHDDRMENMRSNDAQHGVSQTSLHRNWKLQEWDDFVCIGAISLFFHVSFPQSLVCMSLFMVWTSLLEERKCQTMEELQQRKHWISFSCQRKWKISTQVLSSLFVWTMFILCAYRVCCNRSTSISKNQRIEVQPGSTLRLDLQYWD